MIEVKAPFLLFNTSGELGYVVVVPLAELERAVDVRDEVFGKTSLTPNDLRLVLPCPSVVVLKEVYDCSDLEEIEEILGDISDGSSLVWANDHPFVITAREDYLIYPGMQLCEKGELRLPNTSVSSADPELHIGKDIVWVEYSWPEQAPCVSPMLTWKDLTSLLGYTVGEDPEERYGIFPGFALGDVYECYDKLDGIVAEDVLAGFLGGIDGSLSELICQRAHEALEEFLREEGFI